MKYCLNIVNEESDEVNLDDMGEIVDFFRNYASSKFDVKAKDVDICGNTIGLNDFIILNKLTKQERGIRATACVNVGRDGHELYKHDYLSICLFSYKNELMFSDLSIPEIVAIFIALETAYESLKN